jgi:hypothetical protein
MESHEFEEYDITSPGAKIAIEIKVSSPESLIENKIQEDYFPGWGTRINPHEGIRIPQVDSFQHHILQTLAKSLRDPSTGDLEIRIFESDRTAYQSLYADKEILKIHSTYFEASISPKFFRLMDQKMIGITKPRKGDD